MLKSSFLDSALEAYITPPYFRTGVFLPSSPIDMASVANTAVSEPIHYSKEKEAQDSVLAEFSYGGSDAVFEDYLHYAALQRLAEEPGGREATLENRDWFSRFSHYKGANVNVDVRNVSNTVLMTQDEEERANASRALRLASWASVFYLITTDILGPFNAPFAISQVGWVPGISFRRFMIC